MYENCPSKTPKEGRSLRFREMVSEGSLQVLGGIKSLVPGLGPLCPPLGRLSEHTPSIRASPGKGACGGHLLLEPQTWSWAPALSVLTAQPKESESEVTQQCLTLCDPMDCSPPGSSVHGIFQARILEWVAISFSRGFSQPRD